MYVAAVTLTPIDTHFFAANLCDPILPGVDPIIQVSLFLMVTLQIIMHLSR